MDRNDIIKKAKEVKQGLVPSPMHEKIASLASNYMSSDLSTKGFLKKELKDMKRQVDETLDDPERGFKGLLGMAVGSAINEYGPSGVYVNPTLKRLGYKTEGGSNIYLEQPKKDELFRIGGDINF